MRTVIAICHTAIETSDGGIQQVVRWQLVDALNRGWKFIVVTPSERANRFASYQSHLIRVDAHKNGSTLSIERGLCRLSSMDPDLGSQDVLLLHSCLGFTSTWIENLLREAAQLNMQTVGYIHDFLALCPSFHLNKRMAGVDYGFCGLPPVDSFECMKCDFSRDRNQHLSSMLRIYNRLDTLIFPSTYAEQVFTKGFKDFNAGFAGASLISPHYLESSLSLITRDVKIEHNAKYGIAFYGHPVSHKGWSEFLQLYRLCRELSHLQFFCISTRDPCCEGIKWIQFSTALGNNYNYLLSICSRCNIASFFFWPSVPETFGLAFHQAVHTGVIIFARTCFMGGAAEGLESISRNILYCENIQQVESLLREPDDFAGLIQRLCRSHSLIPVVGNLLPF